jgi:hypothetical protein
MYLYALDLGWHLTMLFRLARCVEFIVGEHTYAVLLPPPLSEGCTHDFAQGVDSMLPPSIAQSVDDHGLSEEQVLCLQEHLSSVDTEKLSRHLSREAGDELVLVSTELIRFATFRGVEMVVEKKQRQGKTVINALTAWLCLALHWNPPNNEFLFRVLFSTLCLWHRAICDSINQSVEDLGVQALTVECMHRSNVIYVTRDCCFGHQCDFET